MAYWSSSCGRIELSISKAQAATASHQGQCDADVLWLSNIPGIRKQLNKLTPEQVSEVLREYGAWDDEERADHEQNLQRLVWLACGDINDGNC